MNCTPTARTILMTPGQTVADEWNAPRQLDDPQRIIQGYANFDLTQKGRDEVAQNIRDITAAIGPINMICHGNQLAATQTRQVACETLRDNEIEYEVKQVTCLDFRSFGGFNGRQHHESFVPGDSTYLSAPGNNFDRDPRIVPPNGEPFESITGRANTVIEIRKVFAKKTMLIICDASMLLLLQAKIGIEADLDVLLKKITPVPGSPTAYITPGPDGMPGIFNPEVPHRG